MEKNLFSPQRRYEPYFPVQKKGANKDFLERFLILRGTLLENQQRLAVIEVMPVAKKELGLEDDHRRRFVVAEGESLGECQVLEIKPEEVVLGGRCQGLTLSLENTPERKRSAPAPAVQNKLLPRKKVKAGPPKKSSSKGQVPFFRRPIHHFPLDKPPVK